MAPLPTWVVSYLKDPFREVRRNQILRKQREKSHLNKTKEVGLEYIELHTHTHTPNFINSYQTYESTKPLGDKGGPKAHPLLEVSLDPDLVASVPLASTDSLVEENW